MVMLLHKIGLLIINIINMKLEALPIEKQLALIRILKKEYKGYITDSNFNKGLCYCLNKILIRFEYFNDTVDSYSNLNKLIPIFDRDICRDLCRDRGYKMPDIDKSYWYDIKDTKSRINLLNTLIKELDKQNKAIT